MKKRAFYWFLLHSGKGCRPYAPAAFTSQDIPLVFISVRG